MFLTFKLGEVRRQQMALGLCVLNSLLALFAIILFGISFRMKNDLSDKMMLLQEYNTGTMPQFLAALGVLGLILHGAGAKFSYDCIEVEKRDGIRGVLPGYIIALLLLSVTTGTASVIFFTQSAVIEKALNQGIRTAMDRYKNELKIKVAVDKLQMNTKCCGSRGYKDWYNTGWINTEFVDSENILVKSKMSGQNVYTDSTPFSCCDPSVLRPCIHDAIEDSSAHTNYWSDVTLYKVGCTQALLDMMENEIIIPGAVSLMVLLGFELFTAYVWRLLQTSINLAHLQQNPSGSSYAYVFCLSIDDTEDKQPLVSSKQKGN